MLIYLRLSGLCLKVTYSESSTVQLKLLFPACYIHHRTPLTHFLGWICLLSTHHLLMSFTPMPCLLAVFSYYNASPMKVEGFPSCFIHCYIFSIQSSGGHEIHRTPIHIWTYATLLPEAFLLHFVQSQAFPHSYGNKDGKEQSQRKRGRVCGFWYSWRLLFMEMPVQSEQLLLCDRDAPLPIQSFVSLLSPSSKELCCHSIPLCWKCP